MSRIFPDQFGPPITTPGAIDTDDVFMGSVDGAIRPVTRDAIGSGGYDGVVDVADFGTRTELQLNAADATTGWAAAGMFSGGVVAVNTVDMNEGTGCISALLSYVGGNSSLYYTFATPEPCDGRTLLAIDVRYNKSGPAFSPEPPSWVEARVASGTALTGGVISGVELPSFSELNWVTVLIPLTGLTEIKSVGLYRTSATGVSQTRCTWYIDDVRFVDETPVDQARGSAIEVATIVGPTYTDDPAQRPLSLDARKPVLDLKDGRFTGLHDEIHLHDYFVDETGQTDVASAIGGILNSARNGQKVIATHGAVYRFDHDITVFDKRDVTIDFSGATLFLTYQSNTVFFTLFNCQNVTLRGGTIFGIKSISEPGSGIRTLGGTPVTVGTTKALDGLGDKVGNLNSSDEYTFWARALPQQIGIADDGLGPRNYWHAVMSDTAQVPNDCIMRVQDDDGNILASQTVTLTATPTSYAMQYFPTSLRTRLAMTIEKATATANTITITTYGSHGRTNYSDTWDAASGVIIKASENTLIEHMWIEGVGSDAIQVSDGSVRGVTVRYCTSRAVRRQGMSFNRGQDFNIHDIVIAEPGRSGIDFEPFASDWFTRNVTCRRVKFYNVTNYGFAMTQWARNFEYVVEDCEFTGVNLGCITGGARNAVFRNLRNLSDTTQTGLYDFRFSGINVQISGIVSHKAIGLGGTSTGIFDDGINGPITFSQSGNVAGDLHLQNNFGGMKLQVGTGWDLIGPVFTENIVRADFSQTTNALGPVTVVGPRPFSGLNFGEYNRQLPNTFKGIAHSSVWVPGGFNHLDDPVYNVRSISGTTTRGNNFGQRDIAVGAGLQSTTVAFPTRNVGVFSAVAVLGAGTATTGTLTPSTTYYYRLAPRGRIKGPGTYMAQMTRTTGVAETAIQINVKNWMDLTNDLIIEGFTLLRGTVSGGPYTTRYDVIPVDQLPSVPGASLLFHDQGSTLAVNVAAEPDTVFGYASSYAASTGSWTAALNETGWEPDTNYDVFLSPSWVTAWRVTAKTTAGFTMEFGTPAPAGATCSYKVERLGV